MIVQTATAAALEAYVCPGCKGNLQQEMAALQCRRCGQSYPLVDGMVDFVREELATSDDPLLRKMSVMDRLARFYESRLWYHGVLNLIGGFGSTTLAELIAEVSAMVRDVEGRILDVACGPGTYGRRVASAGRDVFGIDISLNMLRQGLVYTSREGVGHMHFARARVEALPFGEQFFDAALCCGSLHLFPDTVAALREIARALKPDAVLAAMTFTPGGRGLLRFARFRQRLERNRGVRVFALPEMQEYLAAAGFDDFRPTTYGSILVFRARRGARPA